MSDISIVELPAFERYSFQIKLNLTPFQRTKEFFFWKRVGRMSLNGFLMGRWVLHENLSPTKGCRHVQFHLILSTKLTTVIDWKSRKKRVHISSYYDTPTIISMESQRNGSQRNRQSVREWKRFNGRLDSCKLIGENNQIDWHRFQLNRSFVGHMTDASIYNEHPSEWSTLQLHFPCAQRVFNRSREWESDRKHATDVNQQNDSSNTSWTHKFLKSVITPNEKWT